MGLQGLLPEFRRQYTKREIILCADSDTKTQGNVDLYDHVSLIPFDKITDFFTKNLK